ncbi:MAG TPA: CvpA family protein [Steroidobacteraceae bacterium]|nr:CvpA family protein [Steroidobacteraceae bacterium]
MTPIDYAIIGILAISLVFGMVRGFMREALALLAWLGGLWLAWRYADYVKPMLGGLLIGEPQRTWVARALIVGVVLLVSWIIAELLSYFIHQSGLTVTVDRALGLVFGLLRGMVLVSLLTMLALLVNLDEMRWWKKSILLPYATDVSHWVGAFAETALDSGALPPVSK